MKEDLRTWNTLLKRQDGFCHRCARSCGLADAQFWVLCALCEGDGSLCQNALCENWRCSKQTVSAASASLEKAGLITLTYAEGSRKQKDLSLTPAGEAFCDGQIRPYLKEEENVLLALTAEEREEFFRLYKQLLSGLEAADKEGAAPCTKIKSASLTQRKTI